MSSPSTLHDGLRAGQRQRHQQAGEELARHVAAHAHVAAGADRRRDGWRAADSLPGPGIRCPRRAGAARRPDRRSAARACGRRPTAGSRRRTARAPPSAAGTRCRRCRERAPRASPETGRRPRARARVRSPSSVHVTPSARNAASMTRVSSDSSRSRTRVSPCASAASSSVRLEMLLDPGQPDRAADPPDGREIEMVHGVSCWADLRRHATERPLQPATLARALRARSNMRFPAPPASPRSIAARSALELVLVVVEHLQQRVAVRDADVAPHLGRAAGDAHRVAQAAGGKPEQLRCIAPARQRVDQRVGDDVRQMAHRREDRVVLAGASSRSTRAPHVSHAERTSRTARGAVSGCGVRITLRPRKRSGKRRRRAALLGAGDRMRRHEAREMPGQEAARVRDHVALGAAAVGDDRMRRQMRRDLRHDRGHLADRRREQHEIGILHRERRVLRRLVDHAELERRREIAAACGRRRRRASPPAPASAPARTIRRSARRRSRRACRFSACRHSAKPSDHQGHKKLDLIWFKFSAASVRGPRETARSPIRARW